MNELLCTADDLAHYIVNTDIVPSIFRRRAKFEPYIFELLTFEFGGRESLFPQSQFGIESGYEYIEGFFYLISPIQTHSNSCYFAYVSDKPREHIEGDIAFALSENLGLGDIFEEAVFMAEELERFIALQTNNKNQGFEKKANALDDDPFDLPDELSTANIAFRAVKNGYGDQGATFKNRLTEYLKANYLHLKQQAIERIATVANPDKTTGRKNTSTE